jgi:hypothetical protein
MNLAKNIFIVARMGNLVTDSVYAIKNNFTVGIEFFIIVIFVNFFMQEL